MLAATSKSEILPRDKFAGLARLMRELKQALSESSSRFMTAQTVEQTTAIRKQMSKLIWLTLCSLTLLLCAIVELTLAVTGTSALRL